MTRGLVALMCCASLWVSGCSGASSSTATPTPSVPDSSAPTSTPTPERETPEEFVRRWVEADTHMQNTGDGAEYREMSAKCKSCLDYADYIEGIYRKGGYVKTAGWTIQRARVSRLNSQGLLDVRITIDAAPTEYVEHEGGQVKQHRGGHVDFIITLRKTRSAWSTFSFAQVAS